MVEQGFSANVADWGKGTPELGWSGGDGLCIAQEAWGGERETVGGILGQN